MSDPNAPETNETTKATKAAKPARAARPKALTDDEKAARALEDADNAVAEAQAKEANEAPVRIRMKIGGYIGLGCPDPEKRMRQQDIGFGYDHDHPAQAIYKEVPASWDPDTQREVRAKDVFERGEIVQLFPLLDHERESAVDITAKQKRFTFSRKEALKTAERMVKLGTAEYAQ